MKESIGPRICECAGCGATAFEERFGDGWPGWIQIAGGVEVNDFHQPMFCPSCAKEIMQAVDGLFHQGVNHGVG